MQNQNDKPTASGTGGGVAIAAPPRQGSEHLSENVIQAAAEATGEDPADMRPLYDVVDPDALDRLFDSKSAQSPQSGSGRVSFRFNGCDVTVHADGRTVVSNCPDRTP